MNTRTIRSAIAYIGIVCFSMMLISASCSKEEKQEPQGGKVNDFILMGNNGKTWWISQLELTYYNAAGQIDSVVKPPFRNLEQRMWFGPSGYSNPKEVYFVQTPLTAYIPENGSWSLNIGTQTLTLKCFNIGGGCTTVKDGEWLITHYGETAYGQSLNLEKIYTLNGGRKMKVWVRLFLY